MSCAPRVTVHPEGRFFQTAAGEPFFYLADTVWLLFNRLTLEEVRRLFRDRIGKGFTVVQAVVFRDLFTPNTPKVDGVTPFASEADMYAVNLSSAWLDHVAAVVEMAAEMGLVMALLPTWGDKWNERSNSAGPVIIDPDSAHRYGRRLSDRLATYENLIWVLGGDSHIRTREHLAVLDSMAAGIRAGGAGDRPMTFHPGGGTDSANLHAAPWLDFHGLQTGHHMPNAADYARIEALAALRPRKPVLDIEPNYEVCPMFLSQRTAPGRTVEPLFSAYDVRKCYYRSVLAGAAGFTYGCDPIRQCLRPGDRPHAHHWEDMPPWFDALDAPGSSQLQLLKRVLHERRYPTREPAQELLTVVTPVAARPEDCTNADPVAHVRVARCRDGTYLMVYLPVRQVITLDTGGLAGDRYRVSVYDPAECRLARRYEWPNTGNLTFIPEWDLDCFVVLDAI